MQQPSLQHILTTGLKENMISYLKAHPERFEETLQLALTHEQPYAWRATWVLFGCIHKNDKRIQPHIDEIITFIPTTTHGHAREFLRILLEMNLNDEQEGRLFDFSLTLWEDIKIASAVRARAFKMIVKIMESHPELHSEIQHFTEPRYVEPLSKGIQHAILKMIRKLNLNQ